MHILITAGGTREYIDPVRFISNASSGKMGFALARAALKAGHKVTLIAAPTAETPPKTGKIINLESAAEMFAAVKKHFPPCDCLIMAAAVSDYTPARRAKSKIKRAGKSLTIRLKPTVDILKWAAAHKKAKGKRQIVVGFALEDKSLRMRAQKKLKEKNLDMIIANAPTAVGAEKSTVLIKRRGSRWVTLKDASKDTIAGKIILLVNSFSG